MRPKPRIQTSGDRRRSRRRARLAFTAAALAGLVILLICRAGWTDPVSPPPGTERLSTPQAPSTQPTPPPPAGRWTLKFRDEFEGAAPGKIWTPHQYWDDGPTVGEGDEESDPDNVTVADGTLRLSARNRPKFGKPFTGALVQAGGIRGKNGPTFSFLHGYAEARMEIPAGRGLWPAFWLMPASYRDANGEIDIVDNGTGDPLVLHGGVIRRHHQQQHRRPDPLSPGFHVFGIDWQADRIVWYVDGAEWARTADKSLIPDEPMYPIFDLAVGGAWPGPPDASTPFPAVLRVDWIRVWQKD